MFPLDYGATGIVDHQVFFVESRIPGHDSGQWVADLDTLEAFGISNKHRVRMPRRQSQKQCAHPDGALGSVLDGITSLHTWEEVLGTCPGVSVVRAHKNWPARRGPSVMLSKTRRMVRDSEDPDNEDSAKNEQSSILENKDNVC